MKPVGSKGAGGRPSEKEQLAIRGAQGPPEMPLEMTGKYARELWTLAVETLPHVLRPVDGPVLRLCCESYQSAMDHLAESRTCDKAHQKFLAAITKFDALAKQIGLNPHCRRVIKPVAGEDTKGDDSFATWARRGGLN